MLCEIETDKAVVGFDTVEDGYIAKIFFEEGAEGIDLGTPICIFVTEEADVAAFADYELGQDDTPA